MKIPGTLSPAEAAARQWDAAVVGAGPAGSMTARELARRGRSVLLVDKASFPRTKVCGCCLSGSAIRALNQTGLSNVLDGAVPLSHVLLAQKHRQAGLALPAGMALSRNVFDAALIREAIASGAHFLPGCTARPQSTGLGLQNQHSAFAIATEIIVAAEGLNCSFAAAPIIRAGSRLGAGAIAPEAPRFFRPGTIYMACGRAGYVGLVRLEDGQLDLAAALDPEAVRQCGGIAVVVAGILNTTAWPTIDGVAKLPWRGTPLLTRHRSLLGGDRLFLVGDAAGYVEPFTGEGMGWALHSAIALAPIVDRAIDHWQIDTVIEWTRTHRRLLGARQRRCRLIARVLRSAALTRVLIKALAVMPSLARPFVRQLNGPSSSISHGEQFRK